MVAGASWNHASELMVEEVVENREDITLKVGWATSTRAMEALES